MEFLVKRVNKLTFYYSLKEMKEYINQLRKENNIESCTENFINVKIDYIKLQNLNLKIENSANSYYCPKEKKLTINVEVKTEHIEMIEFQIPGLLNFIVEEMGQGKPVTFNDMLNQANYLESYYNSSQFVDKLEEKYPEKTKSSINKPKKI